MPWHRPIKSVREKTVLPGENVDGDNVGSIVKRLTEEDNVQHERKMDSPVSVHTVHYQVSQQHYGQVTPVIHN